MELRRIVVVEVHLHPGDLVGVAPVVALVDGLADDAGAVGDVVLGEDAEGVWGAGCALAR